MSAGVPTGGGGGRGRGHGSQDFEVNITPIIDFFTVLIAFLLLSASYIAIGVFDAGIAAGGQSKTAGDPPPVNISVALEPNQVIEVKVTGKATQNFTLKPVNGAWNYAELTGQLQALKTKWPTVTGMTLVADNGIEYKTVIEALGTARKTIPNVLLGGF
ncbi:MAG: ExbD/TolR family protein [Bacteriovoracia bacterium]